MSQQIIFADGTALAVANIKGDGIYYQGFQRDSLEIQIAKGAISFDALDALTADSSKTDRLTIITQDGDQQMQAVYDHYVIRSALALKSVEVPATADTPAVTEERFCVTLAQLTYAETQQAEQAATIDALGQQIVALTLGGAM